MNRAEGIRSAALDAIHTLPVTVWAAMSFEDIRTRVRQVVGDASDDEVRGALSELEQEGLAYRRPQTDEERQRDADGWYGPGQTLAYEIREVPDPNGALVFQLLVENQVSGAASASTEVLNDMHTMLGMQRSDVASILRRALREHAMHELKKMKLGEIRQLPEHDLRFSASYVYRDFDDVQVGAVWYDVPTSRTGPDTVPAVVKNRLRTEVHKRLAVGTGGGTQRAS
jgi:hypothetical protein